MTSMMFVQRGCPVCGSRSAREEVHSARRAEDMALDEVRPFWSGFFRERVFFSYDRCEECGLLFAPSFFDDAQLADLYSAMAPNMQTVTTDAIEATQHGYYDVAAKEGGMDGGFLEIGPDVGHIVRRAKEKGAFDNYWLFEPNAAVHGSLSAAAHGRPHTISSSMTDLSAVPDGSVGLAIMVHVLDHLLDPMSILAQVQAKLRVGGTLMIVTHNEASLLRWLMGVRWPPFCLQHPEIYRPASMRQMIRRAGFASVKVRRSRNYFPIAFLIRQAAWRFGINLDKLPLPNAAIGLKLGNMITLAKR